MTRIWALAPRESVENECRRRGRSAVVDGCAALLQGGTVDDELILALGGPAAEQVLDGAQGGRTGYWPRVWAVRGLLHVWSDEATPALVLALGDESWRVREMAAKVVAKHLVGDTFDEVAMLRDDAVPRVRMVAERAVIRLTDYLA